MISKVIIDKEMIVFLIIAGMIVMFVLSVATIATVAILNYKRQKYEKENN